jgi:hypothetical protein
MKKNYEVPEIEVIDVKIEKGFAATTLEGGTEGGGFDM